MANSIYIIFNNSFERDDFFVCPEGSIQFITTDEQKAREVFETHRKFCREEVLGSLKWHYEYNLVRYDDGWKALNIDGKKCEELDSVDNEPEESETDKN